MRAIDKAVNKQAQEFLGEEIVRHADTHGFAFLLDQETLLEKVMDIFGLSRSEALWQMTIFIQDNSGPEGDLVVIDRDGHRFFQWRCVEWPSWLPWYVKKPKWHKPNREESFSVPEI
jgi:hypothetical protein